MLRTIISNGLSSQSTSATQTSHPRTPLLTSLSHSTPLSGASSLVPVPASPLPAHSMLKQEDYPNVKFWHCQDWLNHVKDNGNSTDLGLESVHGKTLMSKGINKSAKYIEDANGWL